MQRLLAFHHIVEGMSKVDAALKAGYKRNSAETNAASMIKMMAPYCATLQGKKNGRIQATFDITVDRVADELARIGFYNPKDYIRVVMVRDVEKCIGKPINELTDDQARAIQTWETERCVTDDGVVFDYRYTFYDKRGAAGDLGRHLGMFNDRLILEARITKHHKVDLSGVPDAVLEKWMAELEHHAGGKVIEGEAEEVENG
jgi:phage terminase small subunit